MREKLNELICDSMENGCVGWCNRPPCYRVERVADHLIANGVTIQAHGQWVKTPIADGMAAYEIHCSICGDFIGVVFSDTGFEEAVKDLNYCSKCGAQMIKEDSNG